MSDLPNRIREIRTERKLSLDKLAAIVGCSKVQLSDLELGKRRLSTMWMDRIAPALGVDAADLLLAEQNPYRLSAEEYRIIERYRAGSEEQRQAFDRVSAAMLPVLNDPAERAA